ncbi:unnamed protein product, partial [Brassica rapa]
MGPATRDSALLTVRDLIHEVLGEWNKNLIQALLSFEEERIMRLKPSPKGAPDALKWLGEKLEEYSEEKGHHIRYQEPLLQVATVVRTDAAWLGSNLNAGLSWIVMSAEERTIGKRGASFTASVLIAEGLALREAMLDCRARGFKEV